jgi:hypothetical protein
MIEITSKANLNRAVANALHPEPPASERRAIHESGCWRWARYHTPVTRNEWGRWEPADFCGDPVASRLLRERYTTEHAWWAMSSYNPEWVVTLHAFDAVGEGRHVVMEIALALAALRALGVEFELTEGWDTK